MNPDDIFDHYVKAIEEEFAQSQGMYSARTKAEQSTYFFVQKEY